MLQLTTNLECISSIILICSLLVIDIQFFFILLFSVFFLQFFFHTEAASFPEKKIIQLFSNISKFRNLKIEKLVVNQQYEFAKKLQFQRKSRISQVFHAFLEFTFFTCQNNRQLVACQGDNKKLILYCCICLLQFICLFWTENSDFFLKNSSFSLN